MPLIDGKYVTPNWQNGRRPPINAEELSAIGNALEGLTAQALISSNTMVVYNGGGDAGGDELEPAEEVAF